MVARLLFVVALLGTSLLSSQLPAADPLPVVVTGVELQPLAAQAERVASALELLGTPLGKDQAEKLKQAMQSKDHSEAIKQIQAILDPMCVAGVNINPESRVKVAVGAAEKRLEQHGWNVFLVKVHNEAGVTAELRAKSPNAQTPYRRSSGRPDPPGGIEKSDVENRWLDLAMHNAQPLNRNLSGLALEYRIIQLYSRDAGKREAKLAFDVGQGTQDLGFRNEIDLLFDCRPAVQVKLQIVDDNGQPTMGQFVFKDDQGRVYPAMTKRLAPDFFFHPQIYRAHGETVLLPPGKFHVSYTRGPEYVTLEKELVVAAPSDRAASTAKSQGDIPTQTATFRLKRWIDLAKQGWYSGDHHVHAAGCAHYEAPTEGVRPEDMMRHILGEDLNVGCVLSWGPCWYAQKQFFEGKVHELSRPQYLMRYDIEVSGFPSSGNGHLCLLRLKEDDYPGTTRIEEWPTWNLPVLKWGKEQGGVVGYSHSGWGLAIKEPKLLSYEMPPFDGIGANEYVVSVTHGLPEVYSTVDTPYAWELNTWYHALNVGFRTRISGETDFPCIYGERVGLGRSYVRQAKLDYDDWVVGLREGRNYASDGKSHLIDFRVNGVEMGSGKDVDLPANGTVTVTAKVAAFLEEQPNEAIRKLRYDQKPYLDVERARIGNSRKVPVEVVVNGRAVDRKEIDADGQLRDVTFNVPVTQSSWICLRILPSSHTNPIWVTVDKKEVRASKRSAQWLREAVDVCFKQKVGRVRLAEQGEMIRAYDHARKTYDRLIAESTVD